MALFLGFVLPPKKNESDTESGDECDSDDDFEDHDFQDMQKIAEEKMCCSSSIKLRYVVKRMQELSSEQSCLSDKGMARSSSVRSVFFTSLVEG